MMVNMCMLASAEKLELFWRVEESEAICTSLYKPANSSSFSMLAGMHTLTDVHAFNGIAYKAVHETSLR